MSIRRGRKIIRKKLNEEAVLMRKRTHTWLKFNRLVDETNDNVLIKCTDKITNALGGTKQLLKTISKTVQLDMLNNIYQTLITEKVQYHNNKSNSSQNSDYDDNDDINMNQNVFSLLPNECISHICAYLSKRNISSFKFASRQIAIICLEEMNKISILTYNTNNLVEDPNINLHHFSKNIKQLSQTTRHNPNKRYHSLLDEWSKQYNIPEHNLLIFQCPTKIGMFNSIELQLDSNTKLQNMNFRRKTLLICDNRHFLVANKKHFVQFDVTKHKCDAIKHCRFLILEYFDIMTQSVNVIQFMLCDHTEDTTIDIINKYIECTNINNVWHSKLNHIVKQMHDDNNGKLKLFGHNTSNGMRPMTENYNLCTFQLNDKNSWFETTQAFNDIQATCNQNMVKFQSDANRFCENIQQITVYIKNDISKSIQEYYDTQLNKEESEIYKYDFQRVIKILKKRQIKITFNKSCYPSILRRKIMQLFGNMIDAKYIELTTTIIGLRRRTERILNPLHPISNSSDTFACCLVLYNVNLLPETYNRLYNIRIFVPSENACAQPFYNKEDAVRIQIRYKENFTVAEFANYLFNVIFQSKNHICYHIYKHLLDLYYDMNNTDDTNAIPLINDKISCMIATDTRDSAVKRFFDHNDIVKDVYNNMIDFHMIQTKSDDLSRNVKMTIKFSVNFPGYHANALLKEIGIPLDIWIDMEDTLDYIINKYFNKVSKYINRIYRVATDNIEVIEQNKCELCPYCKKQIPEIMYHQHLSICLNHNFKIKKKKKKKNFTAIY